MFQSAPGDEAGRNHRQTFLTKGTACFNPLPAMKPGGTSGTAMSANDCRLFQSAPGDEAGRNPRPLLDLALYWRFQSAPGDEAGRN